MAPVILALKQQDWSTVRVLATAQHRHMLDKMLATFNIVPDVDLDVMQPNQALAPLTARLLTDLDRVLQVERPDAVIIQGDTTTVLSSAVACFYHRIPVGHVEAGLRTRNMQNPFPEEMNRVLTSHLARWHFAPTESARKNLLNEGVNGNQIIVTGNTVIDALLLTAGENIDLRLPLDCAKRLILVTAHRRENFGKPFENICNSLLALANRNQDIQILYPVHPNPNVKEVALNLLGSCPNIVLCEPLDYAPFIAAMKRAHFIISDSGGVQEEAPALGKPVLVLRDETERPEAADMGVVKLVGCDRERILQEAQLLLDDSSAYQRMACGVSPYGDGKASPRIVAALRDYFV